MRKAAARFHTVGLLLSLAGMIWFIRATVLVGYAAGYGIMQADHNHKVFKLATLACLLTFIAFAISFGVSAIRQRQS